MAHKIKKELKEALTLKDPGYIGCIRRNQWEEGDEPWRRVRGHALPWVAARKRQFRTPHGTMEAFIKADRWMVEFRAGQWNQYWMDDIKRRWAFVQYCTSLDLSRTVFVLHENKGELTVKEVHIPENFNPEQEVRDAIDDYESDPPGRIAKNSARAHRICRYCPVQRDCDLKDREIGDTDDWSDSYDQYGTT